VFFRRKEGDTLKVSPSRGVIGGWLPVANLYLSTKAGNWHPKSKPYT